MDCGFIYPVTDPLQVEMMEEEIGGFDFGFVFNTILVLFLLTKLWSNTVKCGVSRVLLKNKI